MILSDILCSLELVDDRVEWKPCAANFGLVHRFPLFEWHQIMADIDNEEQWKELLKLCSQVLKCFVVYRRNDGEPFGFAIIQDEVKKQATVSIHGGAWKRNLGTSRLIYRGFILLVEAFLNAGVRVRTRCNATNTRTSRFLENVGFICCGRRNGILYYWTDRPHLEKSLVFNLLHR